jgi:alanine-glyoxylate transaminase/serine-glyoxylate transaminase/serine-pyruvate transaminase
MAETGQFAVLEATVIAERFKLDVDFLPGDGVTARDLEQIEAQAVGPTRRTRSRPLRGP